MLNPANALSQSERRVLKAKKSLIELFDGIKLLFTPEIKPMESDT